MDNEARLLKFGSMMTDIRDYIPQKASKAGKFSMAQFEEHGI